MSALGIHLGKLQEEIEILEEQERKFYLTMEWIRNQPLINKAFIKEIILKDLEEYPYEREKE